MGVLPVSIFKFSLPPPPPPSTKISTLKCFYITVKKTLPTKALSNVTKFKTIEKHLKILYSNVSQIFALGPSCNTTNKNKNHTRKSLTFCTFQHFLGNQTGNENYFLTKQTRFSQTRYLEESRERESFIILAL